MLSIGLSLTGQLRSSVTVFSPVSLFAASEPGVWYDPSDLTTMFTDTAGTTPVTTPGQTVALLLDKSKGLVLGPNLALNSDFATDTVWTKGVGVTIGGGVCSFSGVASGQSVRQDSAIIGRYYKATFTVVSCSAGGFRTIRGLTIGSTPGTYTDIFLAAATGDFAIRAIGTTTGELDNVTFQELPGNHATQATAASRPTYGIVPLGGRRNLLLATDTMATQSLTVAAVAHTLAFTGTGTVTLTGASIAGPLVGTGASNRVSLTFTPTAASLTLTVVGSVTLAQLEIGSTATAYQRVTTQYDVTEAGVQSLSYLFFDGVANFLVTPTITPGINKVQVFAGVRKLSDAARGTIVEHSATIASNNGSFHLTAPNAASATFGFESKGTTLTDAVATFAAPTTRVVTGVGDIAGDSTIIRANGTQQDQNTADQGTGNYLAYPLYIGRRGGTTLPFNGQIYNMIVRFGANLDAGAITSTETFVNEKTGAY